MEKLPGMMKDKMPGQGVQPWSVGDIYPLVIARVEKACYLDWARPSYYVMLKYWDVLNAGDDMSGFASYDDAFAAAQGFRAAKAAKHYDAYGVV